MNQMPLRTCLPLALLLTLYVGATDNAAAAEGCVSAQCHTKLLTGTTMHPIAEGCDTCHESVETPHPKKGGTTFKLKKQFFDDLERTNMERAIGTLNRALLVMHSPADKTIPVENGLEIFAVARHPKSFVSLDNATHVLSEPIWTGDRRSFVVPSPS